MFTTECPRCGRELGVSETECLNCSAQDQTKFRTAISLGQTPTLPKHTLRDSVSTKSASRRRPKHSVFKALWKDPSAFLRILAAFFLGIIGTAVYNTNGEWFGAPHLDLQNIPEKIDSVMTATDGDLEIGGLRTWWDLETETIRVRTIVINHGEVPLRGNYKVRLRSAESHPSAKAIAEFSLLITETLAPRESRDIEVELMSLAHPSALPMWTEQRIELEELTPTP